MQFFNVGKDIQFQHENKKRRLPHSVISSQRGIDIKSDRFNSHFFHLFSVLKNLNKMLFSINASFTEIEKTKQPVNLYSSSLNLFGTIQFKQAQKTGYFGFLFDDLSQSAKIILQRQVYLIFKWSLLRYCCTHSSKQSIIKLYKFINITPDNFEPNPDEIFLYLKNPKFLWRFSMINYNTILKILKSNSKRIKELEIFTTYGDSSAIVPFIDNSEIEVMINEFDNKYFRFQLTAFEISEYLYSDDYYLHLMDEMTNYNEFLQIILSGQCKRYKSKLFLLYRKEGHSFKDNNRTLKSNGHTYKNTKKKVNECLKSIEIEQRQLQIITYSTIGSKFDTIKKSLSIRKSNSRRKSKTMNQEGKKDISHMVSTNIDNELNSLFVNDYHLPMSGFNYDGFQIPIIDDPTKTDLISLLEFDINIIKFNDKSIKECYKDIERLITTKVFVENIPQNAVSFIGEINQPYPFFTIVYLNVLVEKRKRELSLDNNLLKSHYWIHNVLKSKLTHPFPFYRFIYSCYGKVVNVKNTHKNGLYNEDLMLYWEPPKVDLKFEYYANEYNKLVQENTWVLTYSARLRKLTDEWIKFQKCCKLLIKHYRSRIKLGQLNNLENGCMQNKITIIKHLKFQYIPPLFPTSNFKGNKIIIDNDNDSIYTNNSFAEKIYDHLVFNRFDVFNKNYAKACKSEPEYFGKLRKFINTGKFRIEDFRVNAFIRKKFIIDEKIIVDVEGDSKCSNCANISKFEGQDTESLSDVETIINDNEIGIIEQDECDKQNNLNEITKDIDVYSIDAFAPINPYFINPNYPNPEPAPLNPYREYISDIDQLSKGDNNDISSCNSTIDSGSIKTLNTEVVSKSLFKPMFTTDFDKFEVFKKIESSSSFYPSDF